MYQRDIGHNLSEVKQETQTTEIQTEENAGNGQADAELLPIAVSQRRRQELINLFDEACIAAGRKNTQIIKVNGVKKKYTYRPVLTGERDKLAAIEERRALAVKSIIEFIRRKNEGEEVEKFSDVDRELNEAMAGYFLIDEDGKPMSKEDLALTEWEEINPILQGYSLRTEKPLPLPFGEKQKKSN